MKIPCLFAVCSVAVAAVGCTEIQAAGDDEAVPARRVADMVFAVLAADREVYTTRVVNRLIKEQNTAIYGGEEAGVQPLRASEHWKTEPGTLPLPAQMFRMGAERVAEANVGMTYVLLSQWPINQQNAARTAAERAGLQALADSGGAKPYYASETLGDARYLTAVYADVAVAPACVDCHNAHPDSPRHDFEIGDVMGAVVIRIPL